MVQKLCPITLDNPGTESSCSTCVAHIHTSTCVLDWQNECCLQHTYIQRYICMYVCMSCMCTCTGRAGTGMCVLHVQYMCLLVVCCLCKLMCSMHVLLLSSTTLVFSLVLGLARVFGMDTYHCVMYILSFSNNIC